MAIYFFENEDQVDLKKLSRRNRIESNVMHLIFIMNENKIVFGSKDIGWKYLHPTSVPPNGMCMVTNMYVNPQTGKLSIEYDNRPLGG